MDGLPVAPLGCSPATSGEARRQVEGVSTALPTAEDPELRAALVVTTLLGVTIGHQLLGLAALRDAPADHIAALLRPAVKALAGPPG